MVTFLGGKYKINRRKCFVLPTFENVCCLIVKCCNNAYFNKKLYIVVKDFENCAYYCEREVHEVSDNFFGVVDGLINAFDGKYYFYWCSSV